jgi:hypothetical protein
MQLQIYATPFVVVSLMISESATTQFSFTISNSTRVVYDDESMCHLWKWFRG